MRRQVRRRRLVERLGARRSSAQPTPSLASGVELDRLLENLDVDRRAAFVLTQVLGLEYAEAAQVCNCPVGTIRSRVARARADLIAALEADDQELRQRRDLDGGRPVPERQHQKVRGHPRR